MFMLYTWNCFKEIIWIYLFPKVPWDGACISNAYSRNTNIHIPYRFNTTAVDNAVTQAAMLQTNFYRKVSASALGGLIHLPLVSHICVGELDRHWFRRQANTRTNVGLLPLGLLITNFSETWIYILSFSFKKNNLRWVNQWGNQHDYTCGYPMPI